MIRISTIQAPALVLALVLTQLLAGFSTVHAQPTTVSYQGSLLKGPGSQKPVFDGTAQFQFALVCGGAIVWNSDNASPQSAGPIASVPVVVDRGAFSIQLGDPLAGMPPLTASLLNGCTDPALRVWVDTGGGFEQLPDQPVSSSAFALRAESAATGSGNSVWSVNGDDVYRGTGRVGIGTSTPQQALQIDLPADANDGIFLAREGTGQGSGMSVRGTNNQILMLELDPGGLSGYEQFEVWFNGTQRVFMVDTEGEVGIGASEPEHPLQIDLPGSANDGLFLSKNGSAFGSGYYVRGSNNQIMRLSLDPNAVSEYETFEIYYNGTQQMLSMDRYGNVAIGDQVPGAKLDVAGTVRAHVLEITGGADIAEPFPMVAAATATPGSVLVMDVENPGKLKLCDRAYDHCVAGVVSGANGVNPGLTLRQDKVFEAGENVALTGRVYARATAANGRIQPGDLLTTSSVPGYAMLADDRELRGGAVLGKAMTGLDAGEGMVLVLVSLQ